MTNKERRALSITIATCGIMLIGSGLIMTTANTTTIKKQYSVEISQKRVASAKVNLIKLKDMELEVGNPISVNVQDYLEDPEELDTSVIKALKLDTSAINASEPGTYTYTIQFKKKKYNGTFTIKEKQLPQMQLTLKEISIPKGTALSTDLSTYVVQTLTDEIKNNTTLDLSSVNAAQVGVYQYSVSYNGQTFVSTINVYNQTVITPNTPEVKPDPVEPTTPTESPATEEKIDEPTEQPATTE